MTKVRQFFSMNEILKKIDSLSYNTTIAAGGFSGMVSGFILEHGGQLLFVFLSGIVGTLGAAITKIIVERFFEKKENSKTLNSEK